MPSPPVDIILSAYSSVLNCCKHHLWKISSVLFVKGRSEGKEKGITKWKNLQMIASGPELQKTTTLWKGCRCQKQLIILTLKNKKKN